MVGAAPWVNVVLLLGLYAYFSEPYVMQPGVRIELPSAPFTGGSPYGHNLVVMVQDEPAKGGRREVVFFNDERFALATTGSLERLSNHLGRAVRQRPDVPLVIEADRQIQHGTVVQLFDLAEQAGFNEVTVATLPAR
jgi:biopolymer transport protein TolR